EKAIEVGTARHETEGHVLSIADLGSRVRGVRGSFHGDAGQRPDFAQNDFADPAHAGWQTELHRSVADVGYSALGHSRSQHVARTVLSAWRDRRDACRPGNCRRWRDSVHAGGRGKAERKPAKPD